MDSVEREWRAAKEAQAVVLSLMPMTGRTATKVTILRNACLVATKAATQNFSNQTSLNNTRDNVGIALASLIHALEAGTLTPKIIDRATHVIEEWVSSLDR
jgi:hypothetical protein